MYRNIYMLHVPKCIARANTSKQEDKEQTIAACEQELIQHVTPSGMKDLEELLATQGDSHGTDQYDSAALVHDFETLTASLDSADPNMAFLEDNTPKLPDVGDAYMDFLATMNIFRNMSTFDQWNEEEVAKHAPTGNSRDPPSPFLYYCPQGCTYSSWCPELVRVHAVKHQIP